MTQPLMPLDPGNSEPDNWTVEPDDSEQDQLAMRINEIAVDLPEPLTEEGDYS